MTKQEKEEAGRALSTELETVANPVVLANNIVADQPSNTFGNLLKTPIISGLPITLLHVILVGGALAVFYYSIPVRKRKNLFK